MKPKALMAYEGKGTFYAGEHCRFCRAAPHLQGPERVSHESGRAGLQGARPPDRRRGHRHLARGREPQQLGFKTFWPTPRSRHWRAKPGRGTSLWQVDPYASMPARPRSSRPPPRRASPTSTRPASWGVGEMEKRMGRKAFQEVLGRFVVKPPGAPTLVPESDSRKPYSDAATDFST